MKTKLIAIVTMTAFAFTMPVFTGCENIKSLWGSPQTQALVAQLEAFIFAQVLKYFEGTLVLGNKKLTAKRYSVAFTEEQITDAASRQFPSFPRDFIQKKVHEAFMKEQAKQIRGRGPN